MDVESDAVFLALIKKKSSIELKVLRKEKFNVKFSQGQQ